MLTFDARVYLRALFSQRKYAVSAKSDMKNIPRLSTAIVFSVFGYIHHSTAYATKKRISIICTGRKYAEQRIAEYERCCPIRIWSPAL